MRDSPRQRGGAGRESQAVGPGALFRTLTVPLVQPLSIPPFASNSF